MQLFENIDLYCERTSFQLLSEPLNLFSNLGFIIAGSLILKKIHSKENSTDVRVLAWLSISVGIGSALFHSFANRVTMWLDILPIGVFIAAFLFNYMRAFSFRPVRDFITISIILFLLSFVSQQVVDPFQSGGSQTYFGVWIILFGLGLFHIGRFQSIGLIVASFVLFGSLVFRSVDARFCNLIPIGTHFLWHLGNGGLFYLLMKEFWSIKNQSPSKLETQASKV